MISPSLTSKLVIVDKLTTVPSEYRFTPTESHTDFNRSYTRSSPIQSHSDLTKYYDLP